MKLPKGSKGAENQGYQGVDVCINTSLFEYHLIWKRKSDDELHFIYAVNWDDAGNAIEFDHGYMTQSDYADLISPDSWVEVEAVERCIGGYLPKELSGMAIYDLIGYYGYQNILGSCYGSFTIKETA